MTHRKGAVWAERLVLALILASLAGTLNLVLAIHRRVISTSIASKSLGNPPSSPPGASTTTQTVPRIPPMPPRVKKRVTPPVQVAPPKPVEDPTAPILARIDRAMAREADAARQADRHAAALEAARLQSVAESERWKRREMLVRQQVATLSRKADRLERDVLSIEAERDVLARERDALEAALVRGSQRSGYAVLPYKGPNGTWRRPIVLECSGNTVKLQPNGPTFSMMELSPLIHPRSSPVVLAIARAMMHIQQAETPDGAPAVPYLVFLVRPDGIRPYYQARARLEPLGIAFGYELIEQDLAVDIPDLDDVRSWDGSVPLEMPQIARVDTRTRRSGPSSKESSGIDDAPGPSTWPARDRAASIDASGADRRTMGRDPEDQPGADRRWPDPARSDAPRGGTDGGSDPSGRRPDGASTPEIDLGGSTRRDDPAGGGRAGGSSDGSPDDFVWPTGSGEASARAAGGRGSGRKGWGSADGTGVVKGLAGVPPAGMWGSDWPGGGEHSRGGAAEEHSPRVGRSSRGPGPGTPLAAAFESGRGAASSPSAGASPIRTTTGLGNGTGSDGGEEDPLPRLEPAQDGSTPGAPGSDRAPDSGGLGGTGSGRTGSGRSAVLGSAPDGSAGGGRPLTPTTPRPGGGTVSVLTNGRDGPDPGLTPYAGGGSGPIKDGLASGSPSDARSPTRDGAAPSASSRPAERGDAGRGADGGRSGAGESNGSADSAPPSSSPDPLGSSSATNPGRRGPGSNRSSESSPILGTPAPAPADAGLPPTPLEAALGSGSSSPGASASAWGAGASGTLEGSAAGSLGAMGGAFAGSSAAASRLSGLTPPSTTPAGMSGLSLPALSMSPDPDSEPHSLEGPSLPPIDTHRQPGAIDVPFEIVVVCRRDDLLLHPGGYRITAQALRAGAAKGEDPEGLLRRELRAIVRRRAQVDPLIRPKPRVKFLVETGGGTTFWTAREQLTFSGLDWPMTVQVAGPQSGYLLDERALR